jgi:hypothetical protein
VFTHVFTCVRLVFMCFVFTQELNTCVNTCVHGPLLCVHFVGRECAPRRRGGPPRYFIETFGAISDLRLRASPRLCARAFFAPTHTAHTSNIGGLLIDKESILEMKFRTYPWVAFTLPPQWHESRDPRHARPHVLHFSAALHLRLTAHYPHMHAHAYMVETRSQELGGSFAPRAVARAALIGVRGLMRRLPARDRLLRAKVIEGAPGDPRRRSRPFDVLAGDQVELVRVRSVRVTRWRPGSRNVLQVHAVEAHPQVEVELLCLLQQCGRGSGRGELVMRRAGAVGCFAAVPAAAGRQGTHLAPRGTVRALAVDVAVRLDLHETDIALEPAPLAAAAVRLRFGDDPAVLLVWPDRVDVRLQGGARGALSCAGEGDPDCGRVDCLQLTWSMK